jgi:hypothetical protein
MLPVENYLKLQGRFRHMSKEDIDTLQRWLCKRWDQRYHTDMVSKDEPKGDKELAMSGEESEGI